MAVERRPFYSGLPDLFKSLDRTPPENNHVEIIELADSTRIEVTNHRQFNPSGGGDFDVWKVEVHGHSRSIGFTFGRIAGLLEVRIPHINFTTSEGVQLGFAGLPGNRLTVKPDNMVNDFDGRNKFINDAGDEFVKWLSEMVEEDQYREPPIKVNFD